jgi:hypothetical protein
MKYVIFFESPFGYDFNSVKVHTDSNAAESAQSINVLAYTSGKNIVFNNGEYPPNANSGKKLLVHELTYVVQRRIADNSISRFIQEKEVRDDSGACWEEKTMLAQVGSVMQQTLPVILQVVQQTLQVTLWEVQQALQMIL